MIKQFIATTKSKIISISAIAALLGVGLFILNPSVDPSTTHIPIVGMTCDACAVTISKALKKTPGVIDTTVTFNAKKAKIVYNPDKVSPEQLQKVISSAGYTPASPQTDSLQIIDYRIKVQQPAPTTAN